MFSLHQCLNCAQAGEQPAIENRWCNALNQITAFSFCEDVEDAKTLVKGSKCIFNLLLTACTLLLQALFLFQYAIQLETLAQEMQAYATSVYL